VRCVWLLEDERAQGEMERVLPDGCLDVVVEYGQPMERVLPAGGAGAAGRSIVAGQLHSAMQLRSVGPIGMLGVRFEPWAAGAFLREAAGQLTDEVTTLDSVWGPTARELEERIAEAPDDETRMRLLTDEVERQFLPPGETGHALREAVRLITGHHGDISVAEIARRLQWSRRRLERHFASAVGLSPKTLCRIERFQRVVQDLGAAERTSGRSSERTGLAGLALDAGYADQAHLARDFKRLAGLSVTSYLAEQHVLSDCFTVGSGQPEHPTP